MRSVAEKREAFRALHESGCFLIPNPWDVGSAIYLEHLGFKALATTSAGFAFSRGLPDYAVPLEQMLAHIAELVAATDVPVNADFANGYADNPEESAANVRLCVATGVAGLSIEDSTGRKEAPLYELAHAAERIAAARAAIDSAGGDILLVARTECFLVGRDDLAEATRRLSAFAKAGADCLYAPGISEPKEIAAVVAAVAPRPVNVLVGSPGGLSLSDLAALGVRRVSVGGALARAAWGEFIRAAKELAEGNFHALADGASHSELDEFFARSIRRRVAAQ